MDIDNDEPENSDKSSCSSSSSSVFENDSDVDLDCDPSICSLCEATDRPTTDIGNCEELKSIKQYIESTSSKVKEVRFVCQTCLYKLYTVIDQNRLKACRQMRGVHLGSDSVSSKSSEEPGPSTSDCTVNETPAQSHTFDANEMFAPRNLSPETIGTEKHPSEGIDDSLGDPRIVTEHPVVNEQFNESSLCIDAHEAIDTDNENDDSMEKQTNNDEANTAADAIPSSQTSSHSHLDVMYEQTESALATESGGTLEQYKTPPLQCCFCTKEFVLQKAYNKHMRTHHSRLLSTRSGSSSRGRSTPHNAVHECVDCSATFDSSTKLKTHSRIHLKRYYCMYCHKESLSQFDHDFHEAECRGGHMAKDESVETTGRMTRSRARSLRSARNPNATDDGKSEKSAGSKPVSKRSRSRKSIGGKTRNGDADGEDDDDDAATSVAYTDYTQINRDVAKWVAGTCFSNIGSKASSVKSLNISECNTDVDLENISDAENMPQNIVSHKEYDIIMLERLIHQTESNVYICSYLDCDHLTNTLREMCLHEILIHKLKPHFYCRKCKGVFTSKLYLDYHLHLQNYGEYQCNKCSMRFNFEYLLQYHLIQHQKNNSFPCLLCGNSFMSTQELRIHCIETGHDPKKRKKLITIDPTMSIANDVAAEAPPPKRTYKSTINIMNLPKTPSLQPRINMKRPKGRSIFLGEIDFVYQLGLNCVRTK